MWSDNKTNRDFLNFRCVVDTAAAFAFKGTISSRPKPLPPTTFG